MKGAEAERLAARWLEQRGLHIIQRNWSCRFGEIDLIARAGSTLVFIEVRCRSRLDFGGAAASITRSKRERLLLAARHYLATLDDEPACRFDALVFEGGIDQPPQWLQNIFD